MTRTRYENEDNDGLPTEPTEGELAAAAALARRIDHLPGVVAADALLASFRLEGDDIRVRPKFLCTGIGRIVSRGRLTIDCGCGMGDDCQEDSR